MHARPTRSRYSGGAEIRHAHRRDLFDAIVGGAPDGILLPKTTSAADAVLLDHYLSALEVREGVAPNSIRILPVATETAAASPVLAVLTPRELEVLRALTSDAANEAIARRLGISGRTLRNHIRSTYRKLGIFDRAQAVIVAVREGLVDVTPRRPS